MLCASLTDAIIQGHDSYLHCLQHPRYFNVYCNFCVIYFVDVAVILKKKKGKIRTVQTQCSIIIVDGTVELRDAEILYTRRYKLQDLRRMFYCRALVALI